RTDPREPLYGLAGHPIERSLSPALHTAALAACALPGRYLPLDSDDPDDLLEAAEGMGFLGMSVTAPLKEVVASRLPDQTDEARACGAVNTLVRKDDVSPADPRRVYRGASTDGAGILAVLRDVPLNGVRVLVLGTGGAARSAAVALRGAGAAVF